MLSVLRFPTVKLVRSQHSDSSECVHADGRIEWNQGVIGFSEKAFDGVVLTWLILEWSQGDEERL